MSEKGLGCLGCLGSLVVFTFVGSMFLGGGVLMRVAGFQFSLGNPIDQQQFITGYLSNLESQQKIASEAVQKIHTQLDRGKCKDIYEQANEMLKSQQNQAKMLSLCTEIGRDLGTVKSTQQVDWWGQPANREVDKLILLRYNTQFSKASAEEIFVILVKNGKAELVSYQVNPSNKGQNVI